ncbi:acyl-CoA dehydrogenase family protein [Demetria terragena]|uniref:acyl-CoA dehydrogenase family protein n=1 Tax=Demetria terragena TaxID=63959 RepID=UPI00035CFDFB|nr:acyl-CoA dehydrogenase family protein [Demetria terragena]
MDFTIDDEQKALRNATRELATRHAPQHGEGGDVPVGPAPHDSAAWTALVEMGALGLPFAEEVGGFGASHVEVSLVATELGRAGLQSAYADALVAGQVLASAGQQDMLEQLIGGESLILASFAQPGRGWSPLEPATTATAAGDDWTLSGAVGPIGCLSDATAVIVPAQTPDGVALFLTEAGERSAAGVLTLDGSAATQLVGPDKAAEVTVAAIGLGVVAITGEALGAMEQALTLTTDYLKTRKQFGVPLMTFQTLTQRAADMYTSLELARSTVLFAAMALAENPSDGRTASRAKVVVGQSGRHIGQEAIQLHGGIGMTAEYSVGHLTSRLTAIEHTFGDTRQHLAGLAAGVSEYDMVDLLA